MEDPADPDDGGLETLGQWGRGKILSFQFPLCEVSPFLMLGDDHTYVGFSVIQSM